MCGVVMPGGGDAYTLTTVNKGANSLSGLLVSFNFVHGFLR